MGENENIDTNWKNFKAAVMDTAEEVCGRKKKRRKKKPWFDHECEQMVEERIERKKAWMYSNNIENRESYNKSNRDTNKLLRRKKRQYILSLLDKAEEDNTANNSRNFFRKIRFFKKGFSPRPYGVKSKEGMLITENQKALER